MYSPDHGLQCVCVCVCVVCLHVSANVGGCALY